MTEQVVSKEQPSATESPMEVDVKENTPVLEANDSNTKDIPEFWLFFSDNVVSSWDSEGQQELSRQLDEKEQNFETIVYEVLMIVKDFPKRLSIEKLQPFLNELLKDNFRRSETFVLLFNCLTVNDNMIQLLKSLNIESSIKLNHLERTTLEKLQLTSRSYKQKTFAYLRDNVYSFENYTLLGESNEGYSRLVLLLTEYFKGENSKYVIPIMVDDVLKIMNHFQLDPVKCLDLIFTISATYSLNRLELILEFLKQSPYWPEKLVQYQHKLDIEAVFKDISNKNDSGGSLISSQLVASKITRYNTDELTVTDEFFLFVSVLIHVGFLKFSVIFDSLSDQPDDAAEKLYEIYKKMTEVSIFEASASALALAGPLPDDDDLDNGEDVTMTDALESNPVKQLSPIEEFQILSKQKNSAKIELLKSFLSIGLYAESLLILSKYPYLPLIDDQIASLINRFVSACINDYYESTTHHTLHFKDFSKPSTKTDSARIKTFDPFEKEVSGKKTSFFFDWRSLLPEIKTREEFVKLCHELLHFNSFRLTRDPVLLSKICRIIYHDILKHGKSQEVLDYWLPFYRSFILPCFPLLEENCPLIQELFNIIAEYPLEVRYNLYGDLHYNISKNVSEIKLPYNKAEKQTKDALKRLSNTNIQTMMRKLAKIALSNPIPCLLVIVQQLESYDNLNQLIVDVSKYFNDFTWDVLPFVILIRLTVNRPHYQSDGINISQWLQSLSVFLGEISTSSSLMNIKPLLVFIIKLLYRDNSLVLPILNQLLLSMGGIQKTANLTSTQIIQLNSERSLKKIIYSVIQDKRLLKTRPASRLVASLLKTGGLSEIFILLCQLMSKLQLDVDKNHQFLKVLGQRIDDLSSLIQLFTEFIFSFVPSDEFKDNFPSLFELCSDFNIDVAWAFELWRNFSKECDVEIIQRLKPDYDWEYLTPQLYAFFWNLSLYDIDYSPELYDDAIKKVELQIAKIETQIKTASRTVTGANIQALKKELSELAHSQSNIPLDKERHKEHSEKFKIEVQEIRQDWFKDSGIDNAADQTAAFLSYCILPRATHSSFDAVTAGKAIFFLYEHCPKNFHLISLLQQLFSGKFLHQALFTSTSSEAENLGIFYSYVLEELNKWRIPDQYPLSDCEHERFLETLFNWHADLLADISKALKAENFMSLHNAIVFLKTPASLFPTVESHCESLLFTLDQVISKDTRGDILLPARSLSGLIKARRSSWVLGWDFYAMDANQKQASLLKKRAISRISIEKRKKAEEEARKLEMEKNKAPNAYGLASLPVRRVGKVKTVNESSTTLNPVDSSDTKKQAETQNENGKSKEGTKRAKLPEGPKKEHKRTKEEKRERQKEKERVREKEKGKQKEKESEIEKDTNKDTEKESEKESPKVKIENEKVPETGQEKGSIEEIEREKRDKVKERTRPSENKFKEDSSKRKVDTKSDTPPHSNQDNLEGKAPGKSTRELLEARLKQEKEFARQKNQTVVKNNSRPPSRSEKEAESVVDVRSESQNDSRGDIKKEIPRFPRRSEYPSSRNYQRPNPIVGRGGLPQGPAQDRQDSDKPLPPPSQPPPGPYSASRGPSYSGRGAPRQPQSQTFQSRQRGNQSGFRDRKRHRDDADYYSRGKRTYDPKGGNYHDREKRYD
ncbi:BA75_01284T0 [Komagataella pastoris]|uniref:THO complex subunit 2 n=1 Tax=Komagataella pastoris TaxID=4922 RepID=A0A1B2J966_PICPA|nr:BA75_01284T0 [Komagataella pastoris]